jgi:AAA domain
MNAITAINEVNYFEGISGAKPAVDIHAGGHLKIAIVGKPKAGKSWFATTAPGPVLAYDFDNRAESLAGKEGVQVKTLIDADQISPTAFKAIEADLNILKYRKSQGKPIPASYVFDSVTYLKKAIENELFTQGLAYRSIKLSPTSSVRISKNWDAVNGVEAAMQYLITEFGALGNIVFVFHEKPEKDVTESKPEQTAYTDQITVDPQYLAKILSRFNEVYRIEIDSSQKHVVTCRPGYQFTASTSLNVDKQEEPNIQNMLKKHQSRLNAAK